MAVTSFNTRIILPQFSVNEKDSAEGTKSSKEKRPIGASGTRIVAEVKVGKRSIIEFFIYPLITKFLDGGIKVK